MSGGKGASHLLKMTPAGLEQKVRSVAYPGAGYGIFMQGSQILHRVSPVLAASEPRISCVTSYMSRDVFDQDTVSHFTHKTM